MAKRDLLEIVLKVFGLYLLTVCIDSLVQAITSASFVFRSFTESEEREELVYFTAYSSRTIVYLIGFWLLTFKTDYLTQQLIKNNTDTNLLLTIDKAGLLQVLFVASGIIITVFSISQIWNALIQAISWNNNDVPENYRYLIYFTQFGVPVTKGIIGLVLIFASGLLARFLTRAEKSYNP